MSIDYTKAEYNINRVGGFSFPIALSIWKTQYQTFDNFERTMRGNYEGAEFNDYFDVVRAAWDDASDLTVEQAFTTQNIEHRRVIFNVMGVDKLMSQLQPELVDSQTITRKNMVFDHEGRMTFQDLIDTYELYKIERSKLFKDAASENSWRFRGDNDDVYVVKCKDASTDREYWIYVIDEIGKKGNALEAIAWTYQMRSGVYTESVYRQGEVIIAKHVESEDPKERSSWSRSYHMDEEDYLNKVKAQS